ncbi:hypothetical protein [Fusobacterium animalis]|uniref:hypothetical protein n=1 Tax=Fusobacterium animalis TaxID=76859 RepID=UPI0030CADAE5
MEVEKVLFAECNLNDLFFQSLREDYLEFDNWFKKKIMNNEEAYIIKNIDSIEGFLYLKKENEEILLKDKTLPAKERIKIGTLKTTETIQGRKYGEGFLGFALWEWANSNTEEIYITTFPKQESLINLLEGYGFTKCGEFPNHELLYVKNKNNLDYTDVKKSFPYISTNATGRLLLLEAEYHDTLFPYSTLRGIDSEPRNIDIKNGLSKKYISNNLNYKNLRCGDFLIVYRKKGVSEAGTAGFKSAVTGIASVVNVRVVNKIQEDFETFRENLKNKVALNDDELFKKYSKKYVIILDIVYNYYFGSGHNINYNTLKEKGLLLNGYPANKIYNMEELKKIIQLGGNHVQNIIVN